MPTRRDLARRTRVPVVPFLPRLARPEEDSVGFDAARGATGGLRVAVVRRPHIASFTDFAPLESEPYVRLIYAEGHSIWSGPRS